eukprot:TRINITY_DN11023_c0_g1_i2.p1 TRINITY_DN11023_c0_g1~~TRINITY_DN11023_c0_g1_i2.p1  ORF type:complete len:299 (-),score=58.34 TRINITY_DN11023_c0_g1_i2:62-847(-)
MDGPKAEFGNPPDDANTSSDARCALRVFATRLQTALSQSTLVLLERLQGLRRLKEITPSPQQAQQLNQLCAGVQCVSYYVQKWALALDPDARGRPPTKPADADGAEDSLAVMQLSLPRLLISLGALQTGIRQLANACAERALADVTEGTPPPRTEEEFERRRRKEEEARSRAEDAAEKELNRRGLTLERLHNAVPHMEQLVYLAGCLANSLRTTQAPAAAPPAEAAGIEPVPNSMDVSEAAGATVIAGVPEEVTMSAPVFG